MRKTLLTCLIACSTVLTLQLQAADPVNRSSVSAEQVRGGEQPQALSLDLTEQKQLVLTVTDGNNGNGNDHAIWGNPTLITKDGKSVSLTTLKPVKVRVGWDKLRTDTYYDGKPLQIGGTVVPRGLLAHAPSILVYKLDQDYQRFECVVGVQNSTPGLVDFIAGVKEPVLPPDIIPDPESIRNAINNLKTRFGNRYPKADGFLAELAQIETITNKTDRINRLIEFQRRALLANPVLDQCDKIIFARRKLGGGCRTLTPCVPSFTAYSLDALNPADGDDDIAVLSNLRSPAPTVTSLFKPPQGGSVTELDLHFNAGRIMYSGLGSDKRWHLHEVDVGGKYIRQLTPKDAEYSSFDGCYLPDGRIVYTSTAGMQGLPCESGRVPMANTYLLDAANGNIRRLTFDQDTNWFPTVTHDGKVMYLRWEYCDLPHYFSRILMTMNPDGSQQSHFYGSNSYWPNAMNCPKQIPGKSNQFIAVISGHHVPRPGPLCLFDINKGRFEADGAVQLIPGHGKPVKPEVADYLYAGFWPKFLNPYPLGTDESDGAGTYFIAACKPSDNALWGIYLVDTFDNIVKIADCEDYAFCEPIPLAKTPIPPVIPVKVQPSSKDATVFISNIYEGNGLKNIPKGKVKALRLFTYHYSYVKAGSHEAVGCESSWDVKRLLGTVPVEIDGSAVFKVPANIPIAIQPIDENGASLQLMRSWFTAMPGEMLSCVGCHEDPNSVVAMTPVKTIASNKAPSGITPWLGPQRNFSFLREVQPLLNRRCTSCHNAQSAVKLADGSPLPDFASLNMEILEYQDGLPPEANGGPFSHSYNALNPYCRRPGPESDIHMFNPMEYHASTSQLLQILQRGHHGVTLTADEWATFYTWIDLNVPFWGSWSDAHTQWANAFTMRWAGCGNTHEEQLANIKKFRDLRNKYQKLYANVSEDFEDSVYPLETARADLAKITPETPAAETAKSATPANPDGWPFDPAEAVRRQGENARLELSVPGGKIAFRRIPAGKFIMGSTTLPDAQPCIAEIAKPFWIAELELSNRLYSEYNPKHDCGYVDLLGKDHTSGGIPSSNPEQPVIRVSWLEASEYAKWLSGKTGKTFRLPTENEWEYAARSGTATPFFWGDTTADFAKFANLADQSMEHFKARQTFNYYLYIAKVNDKAQVQVPSGKYQPNAFGLRDMIGNVAEWTASDYKPYPVADCANSLDALKVARGGAWCDLPRWSDVATRVPYQPYQRVHNVGIRLLLEE